MTDFNQPDRRQFLKLSAAGVAVACLSCKKPVGDGYKGVTDWTEPRQVNPDISNLQVAFCHDTKMLKKKYPANWSMKGQNDVVDGERVKQNLDNMAMAMADKSEAGEAWATLFRKPPGKDWNRVTAAIKVNCLEEKNVPRLAVVSKVCEELGRLGAPASGLTVYDACSPCRKLFADEEGYAAAKMPAGVQVADSLGGEKFVELDNGEQEKCATALADGSIDILVNITVNKGHSLPYSGGFTLSLKNHIGSLMFGHPSGGALVDKLIAINRGKQILGEGPVHRQQLCIVDSLFAMSGGPSGIPTHAPGCLVMGASSPIVDYLTVKKIRENGDFMGVTNTNKDIMNRFLSGFGYDPQSSEIRNLDVIEVPAGV